nr:MAG TPA: hypothetical protein [Caudoviricetes sp.]
MNYKERRELRRAAMPLQTADIVEGFIVGASFLYISFGLLYWWVTGEVVTW